MTDLLANDIPGSGKRAQRKRQERMFQVFGTPTRKSQDREYQKRLAATTPRLPVTAPGYRVVPIKDADTWCAARGTVVTLAYRAPRRPVHPSRRPSRVVVSKC